MWKNYIKFASEKIQESWRSNNLPFKSYNNFTNEKNPNPWRSFNGLSNLLIMTTILQMKIIQIHEGH